MDAVAIYSRKSKLTDKGDSVQNQIDLCKEYALKHFTSDNFLIYEDDGYSGGQDNRPMFQKMIKDASMSKFKILICYRLDRVSRNISNFSNLIDLLQKNNIDFVSIREQFDTSTPMGRAMMYISSVFAQLERETIAERIKDNMYQLSRTGRWLGGKTPMGFESKSISCHSKDNIDRKMYKLSPIPEELEIVKILYYKYLELGSLTKLENWTMENNISTSSKKLFDKSILRFILSNPVYVIADEVIYNYFQRNNSDIASSKKEFNGASGLMVFNKYNQKKNKTIKNDENKWIVAVGKHEGILPSKDWIKVQKLLYKNSKKFPRAGTGKIGLITNFLRCKNCGSKMRIIVYKREKEIYYYYKCLLKEKSKGTKCNIENLQGKTADKLVINELMKISCREKEIYKELNNMLEMKEITPNDFLLLETKLKHHEQAISSLTLQLSRNVDSPASKYIIKEIEELDIKIHEVRNKLELVRENNKTIEEELNTEYVLGLIIDFTKNIDRLTLEEKKVLLNQIVDDITWDGKRLVINILDDEGLD